MGVNRQKTEERIFEILSYINNNTLAFPLKQNIRLFSLKELEQLLEFLETGNFEIIYKFLDEKYKEYLEIIEQIKQIKNLARKQEIKQSEEKEKQKEEINLELLINF